MPRELHEYIDAIRTDAPRDSRMILGDLIQVDEMICAPRDILRETIVRLAQIISKNLKIPAMSCNHLIGEIKHNLLSEIRRKIADSQPLPRTFFPPREKFCTAQARQLPHPPEELGIGEMRLVVRPDTGSICTSIKVL